MVVLIISILMFSGAINVYAASGLLIYNDPGSEASMVCYNQPYYSAPKAKGMTQFIHSDYPIYYRCYVKVIIYDKYGNINKSKNAYSNSSSVNKEKQYTASATISATSSSKAYKVKTIHSIDKWSGKIWGDGIYNKYIGNQYITMYFD